MYNLLLIYSLNILPVDKNIGEIKSKLMAQLDKLKRRGLKNEEAYAYLANKMYNPDLDDEKKKYIDFYYLNIELDEYKIEMRFFEITNTMLLTSDIKCNVLKSSMHRHFMHFHDLSPSNDPFYNFRLERMIEKMEERKFYDLSPIEIPLRSKLFQYQYNNINWMKNLEESKRFHQFTDSRLIYFPDNRIYDYTNSKFITNDDIPIIQIKGGIIGDEVGKGKTIQLLSLCYLRVLPTLILVPNHLKSHWINELSKHFMFNNASINIVSFEEFNNTMLQDKKRIIVDEIHLLYCDDRNRELYDRLCHTQVEHKWGLTATPFAGKNCNHKILQYLTDKTILWEQSERYLYYQDFFLSLFKRNVGKNIIDELNLPPIAYHNHLLNFNPNERTIYESERAARDNASELDLRRICCDVMLKYDADESMTEVNFKMIVLKDFEVKWRDEEAKLQILIEKRDAILKEMKENLHRKDELQQNKNHYENLVKSQESIVKDRKRSFDLLNSIMLDSKQCNICSTEIEEDEDYVVLKCYCPITYHKECIEQWFTQCRVRHHKDPSCPNCRRNMNEYFTLGKEREKALYTTKFMKLLEIIQGTSDQVIVFTQFENIIDKMRYILTNNSITSLVYSEENINAFREKKAQVLILSSMDNACGLDLSFCNQIVIFEPIRNFNVRDTEKQIIGRIYRINQTKECQIHRLIIKDTIEEQIYSEII